MASLVNQLAAGLPDPYRPAMPVMPETPVSRAQRLAAALATPGAPGADISVDPAALLRMGGAAATYDEQGRPITADTLGQAQQATLLSDNALKGLWTGSNPDSPHWANAMASGLGTAMMTSPMLGMIKAYHGSPYDFNEFSMDKIGTGEGAQAYGHGLYFAEHPQVAEQYKKALSTGQRGVDPPVFESIGRPLDFVHSDIAHDIAEGGMPALDKRLGEIDADIKFIIQDIARNQREGDKTNEGFNQANLSLFNSEHDELTALKATGNVGVRKGKTYEVAIDAHPDEFLDWDKPLSEQPKAVQDAIAKSGLFGNATAEDIGQLGVTGEHAYHRAIAARSGGPVFPGGGTKAEAADVTEALRAAGIKGIRYADQGSRGAKEGGTHNYVVFDDKTISILKKYGLAGLTAGGAAAAVATGNYPTEQHPQTKPPPEAWLGVRG